MKYKGHNIIPQRETRVCDFRVDVYDPSNKYIGSAGRVSEAIDLIDGIKKQLDLPLFLGRRGSTEEETEDVCGHDPGGR